jgi:multidrug resistance protein MdtO
MSALAQTFPGRAASVWFRDFLRDELAPYPGRAEKVARMAVAATLVMILCMTFRIPYAFQGALYALIISRESSQATLQSAGTIILVTAVSAVYLLISAALVINFPVLHFFWIISSFFLAFYALSTLSDYGAASTFAIMVAVVIPFLDRHVPAETNVEDTLWLVLSVSVGIVVTAAVELAFARSRQGDEIVLPLAERLAAVCDLLAFYAGKRPPDAAAQKKVIRFTVLGTSTLRCSLRLSDCSLHYRAQMGCVVALVGSLVDIAATLTQLNFELSETDRKQLRNVNSAIAAVRIDLINGRIPGSMPFKPDPGSFPGVPLLREIENTLRLIPEGWAAWRSINEYLPDSNDRWQFPLVRDAFNNLEHVEFGLRGCLAASLCYIMYNALAWPAISTAVTTCLLTALTTVGSSRQKQILRLAGAFVGGVVVGIGAQVFVLPYLDAITGFTLLFLAVTIAAAWIITSSPRLSYFGVQIALAFYLINLQSFKMETSLAVARDRVIGIIFGLCMMWLTFDRLWAVPAVIGMKRTFISALRSLSRFLSEPSSGGLQPAIEWDDSLRETINSQLDQVRAQADVVILEFGPSRQQDLALRSRIISCVPQLRTLFLISTALLKYRLRLPGFELPDTVRTAQLELEQQIAKKMESIAERLEGKAPKLQINLEEPHNRLKQAISACSPGEAQQQTLASLSQTALGLISRIQQLCVGDCSNLVS